MKLPGDVFPSAKKQDVRTTGGPVRMYTFSAWTIMNSTVTIRIEEFAGPFPPDMKAAWDACTLAGPENKRFLTPEWAECWMQSIGTAPPWSGRCRLLIAQTTPGRIVAVLPLAVGRKGHARILTPPGFYQPFRGFVCIPEFAGTAVPALVDTLHALKQTWDILRIFPCYIRTPEQKLFMESLKTRFKGTKFAERGRTIVNVLSDSYDDYARLDSVKKIEYYGRRLARTAPYTIEHFCNPTGDDVRRLMEGLRAVEAKSWLTREQGDLRFSSEANRRFWNSAIASSLSPRQQLNAWVLCVRDVPVAFRFCIISGATSYMIANQYDEAYSEFRPGWLLYLKELEYDCAHGIRRIDMGPGDLHYKGRWGGQEEAMQLEVTVFSPTLSGRSAAWLYAGSRAATRIRKSCSAQAMQLQQGTLARFIKGLRMLRQLRQNSGIRVAWVRVRSTLWHRSRTVLFEASRSQKAVTLPPGFRIVRIHRDDAAIPTADIQEAGAGTDIVNLTRGAICYLAYQRDKPVGLGWMFTQSYLLDRLGHAGKAIYLAGYHVVQSARGQGIYPLLLRTMAHDAASRGLRCLVDASEENRPSIRGIEKAGFQRLGRLNVLVVAGTIMHANLSPDTPTATPP